MKQSCAKEPRCSPVWLAPLEQNQRPNAEDPTRRAPTPRVCKKESLSGSDHRTDGHDVERWKAEPCGNNVAIP